MRKLAIAALLLISTSCHFSLFSRKCEEGHGGGDPGGVLDTIYHIKHLIQGGGVTLVVLILGWAGVRFVPGLVKKIRTARKKIS